jgi:DNA polymerase/3'-5' exonuclease PolX
MSSKQKPIKKKLRITKKLSTKTKCSNSETKNDFDHKTNIVRNFKIMINKVMANEEKNGTFKIRGYTDAIKILNDYEGPITDMDIVIQLFQLAGKKNPKKTLAKMNEIITTGQLAAAEAAKEDPKVIAVTNLTKIYGIGNKKALVLCNDFGITTVEQLKDKFAQDTSIINDKQAIGLTYYDDLDERIPRNEMIKYEYILTNIAKKEFPNIELSINGSYKRGLPTSGDIDVLVTSDGNTEQDRKALIARLKQLGIIVETLANGKKKFMGISKIEGGKNRHIDIIDTTRESYPFGVLYFTGSGGFNTRMRGYALKQGYSINEYGISHKKTKKLVSSQEIMEKIGKPMFESEKDIFDFVEMEYVPPTERKGLTLSKV